jgi:transcriptional regulator with XRE-family HTH domain
MPAKTTDSANVMRFVRELCGECGTQEAAAKEIGVAKSTLSKWFRDQRVSNGSLRILARVERSPALAKAARDLLSARGVPASSFHFAHIASILATLGETAGILLSTLQRAASLDELELAAAQDLIATFADAQFYHALAELAGDNFEQVPEHPLLWINNWAYDEVFSKPSDEDDEARVKPEDFDWSTIDWDGMHAPYKRRGEAAKALLASARADPSHKLFDRIVGTLYSRTRKRDPSLRKLSSDECLRFAALAAANCYKLESAAMEAADTVRRAVDIDRALETSPLYALAAKLFEICYLNRSFTIWRLSQLAEAVREDKETTKEINGHCKIANLALYSEQGITLSYFSTAYARLNEHGTVIDYENGRIVQNVTGKKRKAPRRAIVRADREHARATRR